MVQLKSNHNQKYFEHHVRLAEGDYLSGKKPDIILRMQVDIERRKLEMDAKL